MSEIKSKPTTREYRENFDRIFKKKPSTKRVREEMEEEINKDKN